MQPTPIFFPGESHRKRRLVGYSPYGGKELDTTEVTEDACTQVFYILNLSILFNLTLYYIPLMSFPQQLSRQRIHLQCRRPGLIPELGRSPGEGNSYALQYSGLGNSMERGVWQATVHGVTKSWTQLSDFYFLSLSMSFHQIHQVASLITLFTFLLRHTKAIFLSCYLFQKSAHQKNKNFRNK